MKRRFWRLTKIVAGVALLVLGVIGLFLPFLQGILFLIMGLSLLSTESPRARAWLRYLRERTGWNRLDDHGEEKLDDA
jgi:uncharacterized membrane protein YbaN (DUF454 family)